VHTSAIPQGKKKNGANIQNSVLTLIVLRFRGLVVQRTAILMAVVSLNKLQKIIGWWQQWLENGSKHTNKKRQLRSSETGEE